MQTDKDGWCGGTWGVYVKGAAASQVMEEDMLICGMSQLCACAHI